MLAFINQLETNVYDKTLRFNSHQSGRSRMIFLSGFDEMIFALSETFFAREEYRRADA
jgi:hypothetical protein